MFTAQSQQQSYTKPAFVTKNGHKREGKKHPPPHRPLCIVRRIKLSHSNNRTPAHRTSQQPLKRAQKHDYSATAKKHHQQTRWLELNHTNLSPDPPPAYDRWSGHELRARKAPLTDKTTHRLWCWHSISSCRTELPVPLPPPPQPASMWAFRKRHPPNTDKPTDRQTDIACFCVCVCLHARTLYLTRCDLQ